MHISRRARSLALAFAAGIVPLLLALSLHSQPATPASAAMPRQVADALDKIVQPRFQDVTAGRFGMGRLIPAVRGHQSVGFQGYFYANTPAEAALLASANAPRRPYVIGFLHCAHVPGEAAQKTLPGTLPSGMPPPAISPLAMPSSERFSDVQPRLMTISVSGIKDGFPVGYLEKTEPVLRQAALRSLPAAMKGRSVQTQSGDWTLFLRPVRASKDACLTCHAGAKRGDTLGVMVYAVGK